MSACVEGVITVLQRNSIADRPLGRIVNISPPDEPTRKLDR